MKKIILFIIVPAMLLSGCGDSKKTPVTANVKPAHKKLPKLKRQQQENITSSFDEFFARFNSDSVYQKTHVKFPLRIEVQEEKGDTVKYLAAKEWVNVKLISKGTDIFTKEQISKTEVNILYQVEDTGVHVNYYFYYEGGKWLLANLKDDGD
ncbi:DUF4348 domain-containing protein [Mucilaginibacter pedocola]|uniref:DUF4348 domain-containing protein n=1 Tax=Mucilaginibacter pedocola TaxID=1792845 RepID=A0A1S9PGT7_9SPHI|nr:DUF4348 domain-containing protein [Mucilaginibacter pedocola]OOQ60163.1 hypothetical protein BC343_26960 [Mucilaginibacter pedocola]